MNAIKNPAGGPGFKGGAEVIQKPQANHEVNYLDCQRNSSMDGISNRTFLESLVGIVAEGTCIPVAKIQNLSGGWPADAWVHGQDFILPEGWNGYFCLGSHRRGKPQPRTKDSAHALLIVMCDDIGTKVPRDHIGLEPTYEIETSPGNSQFGFLLAEPLYDMDLADRIGRAITRAKLSDPGAGGLPTRYARLPQCWNSKHNPPFKCQLRALNPERTYAVQELIDGLGLVLDPPKAERKAEPAKREVPLEIDPYVRKAIETELQELAAMTPDSGRNVKLNRVAFTLGQFAAGGEINKDFAVHELEQAAAACGLDESEAGKTIESGLTAGMQEPRQAPGESDWNSAAPLPPWPEIIPFDELPPDLPADILPGILGEFSEGLAHATQTPRELAAVNVLGVVALSVQNKLLVRVKPDYSETLNIYAICGLESGERKSGNLSACKAPAVEYEIEQERKAMEGIREALSRRKTMEKAIEKARNKAANAKTSEERRQATQEIYEMECELPEVPPLPRLFVDDVTPEALAAVMAGSGESIGMLEAEGGALDTLSGRYSNGVANIDLFLKAFCAETVIVDRKGKEPIRLRKPCLTMVLTPQPSVLRAAGSNEVFMSRGLIARCLLVLPRPLVGYRDNSQTIPPDLTQKWAAYVNGLLAIPAQATRRELTLTPEAFSMWLDFSGDVEAAQRPGGEFEFMRSWASKLTGLVVRLAGLLHMAQGLPAIHTQIELGTMQRAVMLATWAAEHAKHAYSCFGLDDGQEAAKRALEWIRKERRETVTARDVLRALRGRFPTMDKIRPGLEVLVDRCVLSPRDNGKPSGKGGRPTEIYAVNPALYVEATC